MTRPTISNLFSPRLQLAMEEASDGKANKEVELVFYAQLVNLEALSRAELVEDHEQWEYRFPKTPGNASSGRMRVRKTTELKPSQKEPEYVLTIKTKLTDGTKGELEVSNPSSEAAFKQLEAISERGMIKRRYVLPIPGYKAKWEIDCYYPNDGTQSNGLQFYEWVKIDLELQDGDPDFVPTLPDGFTNVISPFNRRADDEAQIRMLYDQYFLRKNKYITPAAKAEPAQGETGATPEAPAVQELNQT